jgi:hypothetical protein
MNIRFRPAIGLLVVGLVAGVAGVEARAAQPVPAAIVLNGITTILGDNRACFRVIFTAGLREEDIMLAEGEARYGIQLLAVDTQSNTVVISNQGLKRTVPICKTPTLLARGTSGAGNIAAARAGVRNNSGTASSGAAQISGNEATPGDNGQSAGPGNAAGVNEGPPATSQSDSSPSSANEASSAEAAAGSASTSDNAAPDYHWWEKEAQRIELARQATAQQVMDGTVQPFPLTPFTPSGTPAQLVGTNKAFFYFNPLAAND